MHPTPPQSPLQGCDGAQLNIALSWGSPLASLFLCFISKAKLFDRLIELESKSISDPPLRCENRQRERETFDCQRFDMVHAGVRGALGAALAGAGDIVDPAQSEQKGPDFRGTNPNRGAVRIPI